MVHLTKPGLMARPILFSIHLRAPTPLCPEALRHLLNGPNVNELAKPVQGSSRVNYRRSTSNPRKTGR